ncbi:MAG: hypothetical protein ACFE8P_13580, partial [Promethearchaeota archaeon]
YNKKVINAGNTPIDVYEVCSIIRTTFCTSYGIRKNNQLYIYFNRQKLLIRFEGNKLRYLGPDERSQALLLEKAFSKSQEQERKLGGEEWIDSTPGILVKNLNSINSLIRFLKLLEQPKLTCICKPFSLVNIGFLYHAYEQPKWVKFEQLNLKNEKFFILIPNNDMLILLLKKVIELYPSILEIFTLVIMNNIKSLSDKTLYINFKLDQMNNR